ncbi:hypothetical protein BD626DRAFT_534607 [Schizophyllum amplum]|uniref:Uncharacterized protein n=1 Tax=Schizophyllum amplum TaxID=97359 RepID=A0A550CV30_9AGAR|nr:hypothetical protein BD626DRAFT_534607 [Auriculariopsis ampla]
MSDHQALHQRSSLTGGRAMGRRQGQVIVARLPELMDERREATQARSGACWHDKSTSGARAGRSANEGDDALKLTLQCNLVLVVADDGVVCVSRGAPSHDVDGPSYQQLRISSPVNFSSKLIPFHVPRKRMLYLTRAVAALASTPAAPTLTRTFKAPAPLPAPSPSATKPMRAKPSRAETSGKLSQLRLQALALEESAKLTRRFSTSGCSLKSFHGQCEEGGGGAAVGEVCRRVDAASTAPPSALVGDGRAQRKICRDMYDFKLH